MIRFIFGRASSGKTESIFSRIKAETDNGNQNQILIVPEQSTFDCERKLLHVLGDGKFTSVPVLSFTRLFDEVSRLSGGVSVRRITDCERVILMSHAVGEVADRLSFFGKYANNIRFIENALVAVDEFKRCGIDSDALRLWSDKIGGSLSRKLMDLALINDTYESLIENRYSDPSDNLLVLNKKLSEYAFFAEKTVYIDSFKNFTGAQMNIIERIISQADEVVFSFCFDSALAGDGELFSNVGATIRAIKAAAEKYGIEVAKPEILSDSFYKSEAMAALERGLSVNPSELYEEKTGDINLMCAPDKYSEVELACREIRRLVREEGYRYRDFLLLSRNAEDYKTAVEYMSRRYEIPCYIDSRSEIINMPLPIYLLSLLRAAEKFATEDIFRYLKTDLAGLNELEIATLENYVYIWKINGKKWCDEWIMSPSGLDRFDEKDEKALEEINALRARAIEPILKLRYGFGKTARELGEALWKAVESGVSDRLKETCLSMPADDAEKNRQSFSATASILDSIVSAFGDRVISPRDFYDYFSLALSLTTVGTIPQMIDEVSFGSADRVMPREPKITFILGVNQGVFPSSCEASGIIGGSERLTLLRAGMPITDYTLGFSVDEEYLIYKSTCCASDRVYLSYSVSDDGKPSGIIERIQKILPKCKKIDYKELSAADMIETYETAFKALMSGGKEYAALDTFFAENPKYSGRLLSARSITTVGKEKLSEKLGEQVFGKDMTLSATGIDTYFRCPLSYFCKYGLGIKAVNPAEIDSLHRGTIVHDALEKIVLENGKAMATLSDEEIEKQVANAVEEYLKGIKGIEEIADKRFMYAIEAIIVLTADVAKHIRDDFAQNDFEPIKSELKIGGDKPDIKSTVINIAGGKIKLEGSIDRVDRFGAYIRIVDYKTGSKKFKLPDVLYGLNMQMLLYLYAVMNSKEYKKYSPAGILYLETKRDPDEDKNFVMNGIIARDEKIHSAMDSANEGVFVPRLRRKNDGDFYKSNSFIDPKYFGEIFDYMEGLLKQMNQNLRNGKIPVKPTDGQDKQADACKYCDYASVCGIEDTPHRKVKKLDVDAVIEAMNGGEIDV